MCHTNSSLNMSVITYKMTIAAKGEKSNIPNRGIILLRGASTGSVMSSRIMKTRFWRLRTNHDSMARIIIA